MMKHIRLAVIYSKLKHGRSALAMIGEYVRQRSLEGSRVVIMGLDFDQLPKVLLLSIAS